MDVGVDHAVIRRQAPEHATSHIVGGEVLGQAADPETGTYQPAHLVDAGGRRHYPSFQALRAIPSLAWVPLLLLWLGIDEAPKIVLIAIGAFIDSHATVLTRPAQLYFSQALIAFASAMFVGPALLIGVGRVLQTNPRNLISFIVMFSVLQNVGGLAGSALVEEKQYQGE